MRKEQLRKIVRCVDEFYFNRPSTRDELVVSLQVLFEAKHAYMLTDEDGNIKCSNCGSSECWGNYCMTCGARMNGVKE